jgi:hypothetical protein
VAGDCSRVPAFCLVKACVAFTGTGWLSMVRRRSTVRFRKGAPGYEDFSNIELSTSRSGEWHLSGTRYREGAWDQAFYGAMRRVERFPL